MGGAANAQIRKVEIREFTSTVTAVMLSEAKHPATSIITVPGLVARILQSSPDELSSKSVEVAGFFASPRMTNMNAKLLFRSAAAAGSDALFALATRDDEMIVIAVASPGTRRHIPNFHKLPVGDIGRR